MSEYGTTESDPLGVSSSTPGLEVGLRVHEAGERFPVETANQHLFSGRTGHFVSNNLADIVSLGTVRKLLSGEISSFLDYCRVEKGLASNTLEAYSHDLKSFAESQTRVDGVPDLEDLRRHLDSLYGMGLGSRSIARKVAVLRNFYRFLASEGRIDTDPTERLVAPKQWQSIPKFLNQSQIEDLLSAADESRLTGVRDRAMLELLYATGLRVSELCGLRRRHPIRNRRPARHRQREQAADYADRQKSALAAVQTYLRDVRPKLLHGRSSPYLFVTARGGRSPGRRSGNCWRRWAGKPAFFTT